MRVTITYTYTDVDTDAYPYVEYGDTEYSLAEAFAHVMQRAEYAAGSEGTIAVRGGVSIGLDDDDTCDIVVTASTDETRQVWSFCRL